MAEDKKGFAFNPKISRRSILTGGASTVARAAVGGAEETGEVVPEYSAVHHAEGRSNVLGHYKTQGEAESRIQKHIKKVLSEHDPHSSGVIESYLHPDTGLPAHTMAHPNPWDQEWTVQHRGVKNLGHGER